MVGFRAKAVRRGVSSPPGPFVTLSSVHLRGGGGVEVWRYGAGGGGRGGGYVNSLPHHQEMGSLPGPQGGGYTSYLTLEMNTGAEEEVRLKFKAGAEQRRVLMRRQHK